jgi:hypothetical protein
MGGSTTRLLASDSQPSQCREDVSDLHLASASSSEALVRASASSPETPARASASSRLFSAASRTSSRFRFMNSVPKTRSASY